MTSLCVTDLHKAFGSHAVLTGIDLVVSEGSLAAILGPSGSGKTTLLRVLAGFERADRGTIALGTKWWMTGVGSCRRSGEASAMSRRRVRCFPT